MRVKKVLYGITVLPVILIFTWAEWLLKLLVKISSVATGLMINVLLVCMCICICTRQWVSLGILILCMTGGLLVVYGQATLLYLISEANVYINKKKDFR